MADMVELRARLEFRKEALAKLRKAYLALVDGGVKSYSLEDREVTRLDLPELHKQIEDAEKAVDELTAQLSGKRSRKAFAVLPRDW